MILEEQLGPRATTTEPGFRVLEPAEPGMLQLLKYRAPGRVNHS